MIRYVTLLLIFALALCSARELPSSQQEAEAGGASMLGEPVTAFVDSGLPYAAPEASSSGIMAWLGEGSAQLGKKVSTTLNSWMDSLGLRSTGTRPAEALESAAYNEALGDIEAAEGEDSGAEYLRHGPDRVIDADMYDFVGEQSLLNQVTGQTSSDNAEPAKPVLATATSMPSSQKGPFAMIARKKPNQDEGSEVGETKPTAWSGVFNGVRAMAASFSEENSLPGAARRGPGDVAQEQLSGVSEDATIELREKLALARYHSFVAAKEDQQENEDEALLKAITWPHLFKQAQAMANSEAESFDAPQSKTSATPSSLGGLYQKATDLVSSFSSLAKLVAKAPTEEGYQTNQVTSQGQIQAVPGEVQDSGFKLIEMNEVKGEFTITTQIGDKILHEYHDRSGDIVKWKTPAIATAGVTDADLAVEADYSVPEADSNADSAMSEDAKSLISRTWSSIQQALFGSPEKAVEEEGAERDELFGAAIEEGEYDDYDRFGDTISAAVAELWQSQRAELSQSQIAAEEALRLQQAMLAATS